MQYKFLSSGFIFAIKFARWVLGFVALVAIIPCVEAQPARSVELRDTQVRQTPSGQARSGLTESTAFSSQGIPIKRLALVIGNAKYRSVPILKNAVNDAQDMCAKLGQLGFQVACHYNILNRSDFRQIVRTFTNQLNAESVAFFYYAGHGVQINGENFLLPVAVDSRSSLDMEEDSLNLSYLLRSLELARSSPNIVILDACRDNPFDLSQSGAKGLARIDPPVGTVLVYATSPNGSAIDGDGRNGLFTKHLLANIGSPGRKLDELFQVVALGVEHDAQTVYGLRQVPYRSFSFSGGYCLAGCDDPKVAAQIELIKRQSGEAASRVKYLTEENARLIRQAEERASNILALESRIGSLTNEAASVGSQSHSARLELARLKLTLDAARGDQRDGERLKSEITKRESEISQLRTEIAAMSGKANQLDEYRLRIIALELQNANMSQVTEQINQVKSQSDEATKRVLTLTEENKKLKRQAEDRNANVLALETRIGLLTKEAASAGSKTNNTRAELVRLKRVLETELVNQKSADASKFETARREQEIIELRTQITGLQEKAGQLEELRKRILALEQENADKTRQLNKKEMNQSRKPPIIVPSF